MSIEMEGFDVHITYLTEVLGAAPLNKKIYTDYIGTKKGKAAHEEPLKPEELDEELSSINEMPGQTGFHRFDNGTPFLYSYVVKGFFKSAHRGLRDTPGTLCSKVKAYIKLIDTKVFIYPRRIPLIVNGEELEPLERPLRAQTMQGERVALAKSEQLPAGTKASFTVAWLPHKDLSAELLEEWISYGYLSGISRWRNGEYGRFSAEIEKLGTVPLEEINNRFG